MLFKVAFRPIHITSNTILNRCSKRWCRGQACCFSTTARTHYDETFSLPVGGNRNIELRVTRPEQSPLITGSRSSIGILVYLPPGPLPAGCAAPAWSSLFGTHEIDGKQNGKGDEGEEDVGEKLSEYFPDMTIVDVRYRLSPRPDGPGNGSRRTRARNGDTTEVEQEDSDSDNRFPTPIHDILTAWDYITDQVLVAQQSEHSPRCKSTSLTRRDRDGDGIDEPRICMLGSHIGGSLALMLALTEPDRVHAVAAVEPVVDWAGLDELASSPSSQAGTEVQQDNEKRGQIQLDARSKIAATRRVNFLAKKRREGDATAAAARALIRFRTSHFRTPSGYFDPFASPLLFLRAPGRDTPTTKTAAPEEYEQDVTGLKMRYGEEEGEVGVIEDAGRKEDYGPYDDDWHITRNGIRDASSSKSGPKSSSETTPGNVPGFTSKSSSDMVSASPIEASSVTSSNSGLSLSSSSSSSSSLLTDISLPAMPTLNTHPSTSIGTKRRKVIRRWPPITQPEETELPHINIFVPPLSLSPLPSPSTPENDDKQAGLVDLSPITRMQGAEMVDVMRRACFWGREKGVAEERIMLSEIGGERSGAVGEGGEKKQGKGGGEQVLEWLRQRLDEQRG